MMDAFTQRVELEDDDVADLAAPLQPPPGDAIVGGDDDDTGGGQATLDDDQVVPGQEHHLETPTRKRRTFYEAPEFVQRLNVFEEVEQGGGLAFECQVRAFPRPVVKWFKDDVEISSLSEEGRVTAEEWPTDTGTTTTTGSQLLRLCISDARKADEGAYRCKAENEEGVAATTGYLSVTGPSSPRNNGVSSAPLLRAITEQQSAEEREAANYQLQTTASGSGEEDYEYERLLDQTPDNGAVGSQLGWTYVDYMKAAGLDPGEPARDGDSGSDTSVEADVEDRIVVVKHPSSSSAPVSTGGEPQSTSGTGLERSGTDAAAEAELVAGSVNVFVVESKQVDAARDGGTPNIDMKPLLIQGDVGFQPTVPQPDLDAALHDATQEETSGPSSVSGLLPFQAAAPHSSSVSQTGSGVHLTEADGKTSNKSGTVRHRDEVEQPKSEAADVFPVKEPAEVAGGPRPPAPTEVATPPVEKTAVAVPRPVVELSFSVVMDFYASWFDSPWIVYLLVVLLSTLMASATEADPAILIVTVLFGSAFCFLFYPPPSNSVDGSPAVTSPE